MKNILLVFVCLLFFNCSNDDGIAFKNNENLVQEITVKTLGGSKNDVANAIAKTTDGGYIIAGYTQSNNSDISTKTDESFDFWVLKFSADNSLEWKKNFGGSEDDRAADIIQTKDGNFAILGYTRSSDGNVTSNAGFQDFWLLKITSTGNLLWQKTYGFSGADYGTSLLETNDNGFLITGVLDVSASGGQGNAKSSGSKHAGGDYWVIKTDNSGTLEWSKYYGGSFTDAPLGVVKTADNGYILAGSSDSNDFNIKNNKGTYDFWVIKISETGDLLWEKSFGGSEIDEARAITATNDGNFIVVGDTRSSDKDVAKNNGAADVWIVKIAPNGEIIWEKTIGGTSFDVARSVSKTQDNGFIVAGSSRSLDNGFSNNGQNDALVLKVDKNGKLLWQKTIGGSEIDFLYDVVELDNKSIIAVGESSSADFNISENKGFTDVLIIQIK
ncbi:hypothetical protein H9I45_10875 [Polaribacter haliotis]|uniref:Bulb-type lectin domain-containing protein n=1 Tax=Polaribacter haliotis TaxID=1888915 RepID=A0A7L8ACZ0_9FLAO|nr:hypothetical protein [Polaribacter haliotis]QOD59851.1 hypothetical protein H9I45_10875 [Polaribacter haliotis]